MKPNGETNNANEHINMVKIPTGRRQTGWLFPRMMKELN